MDRRPANQEMIGGYLDGRDPDSPEPSANRSHSYRHGFIAGRADLNQECQHSFDQMQKMADAAMDADASI